MSKIRVLKFGGTSVGSPAAIRKVVEIIRKKEKYSRIAAVAVSAFSGVTDQLVHIGKLAAKNDKEYKKFLKELKVRHRTAVQSLISKKNRQKTIAIVDDLFNNLEEIAHGVFLIRELSPSTLDYIMSYGERLCAHIIADVFSDRGVPADYLNARRIILTDDVFGAAAVDFPTSNRAIRAHFSGKKKLQVVTGFIGATSDGRTTTLGRGGSDYTASIVAAALNASVVEIWTDVPGVMTADPRFVKDAFPVPTLTYAEAFEVSYFGAKVIHPPTMQPAREKKIPILIKNTFDPDAPGTVICERDTYSDMFAKSITSIRGIALLTLQGNGIAKLKDAKARFFSALSRCGVNIILITQASSQNSITIALAGLDADRAQSAVNSEFEFERHLRTIADVQVERDLAIISVVGENMKNKPGTAGKLFQTLGTNAVNIIAIAQGSSELNISLVVNMHDTTKALNAIHASFFFPKRRDIHVFLVGTGLIGGTLLDQIAQQREFLERERGVRVRVVGIANEKRMGVADDDIEPRDWRTTLASGTKARIPAFISAMKKKEMPNKVFVDCTASESIAALYDDLLHSGIWVVTPNKRANSGPYQRYSALQQYAAFPGVQFFYETNVGAGLPIINTLNDLRDTGDHVHKVEGILSGTLSYIFNTFTQENRFSDAVREAKEKGLTEPDPRSDLSGEDVARKILILAREIGYTFELKDVHVEKLLPKKFDALRSPDEFFALLERENDRFEAMRADAEKKGRRLRYVASLENGKAHVGLEAIDRSHPFYHVRGSDNIVAFTTDRYQDTPLIVQGPGAGASVTAGGVLADILRIGMTV